MNCLTELFDPVLVAVCDCTRTCLWYSHRSQYVYAGHVPEAVAAVAAGGLEGWGQAGVEART